jgi:hypothetical protein
MLKLINFDLSDVQVKGTVPEGTFTGKAKSIVSKLMEASNGDSRKAKRKLTFYINRAGDKLSNKSEINKAKKILNNFSDPFDDKSNSTYRKVIGNGIIDGTQYITPVITGGISAKMVNDYNKIRDRYVKLHKGKAGGARYVKVPAGKLGRRILRRNLPSIIASSVVLTSTYGLGKKLASDKKKNVRKLIKKN